MKRNPLGIRTLPGCPPFEIIYPGPSGEFGSGKPTERFGESSEETQFAFEIMNEDTLAALCSGDPSYEFSVGYVRGTIQLHTASDVALIDVIRTFYRYVRFRPLATLRIMRNQWQYWVYYRKRLQRTDSDQAFQDINRHYSEPDATFVRMLLGPSLKYSGAMYFRDGWTLDGAQQLTTNQTVSWLNPQPGHCILDNGCGWLSLEMNGGLVAEPKAKWFSLTASQGQYAYAQQLIEQRPELAKQLTVALAEARTLELGHPRYPFPGVKQFDGIAHIGKLEHDNRFGALAELRRMSDLLRPGGVMVLQTIVRPQPGIPNRWFTDDRVTESGVFPGSDLLHTKFLRKCLRLAGFVIEEEEEHGPGYARTTSSWYDNFARMPNSVIARAAAARGLSVPADKRYWQLYLVGVSVEFELGLMGLKRFKLRKPL